MEQQKTKILIIMITLLVLGLIGGWIFVVRNMLHNPNSGTELTTDIQQQDNRNQKPETGTQHIEQATTSTGQLTTLSGSTNTGTIKSVNKESDNQQSLSQRAFRVLLPPGHDITTWKRIVKYIYSQSRIIAIPYIASNIADYEQQRLSGDFSLILEKIDGNHRILAHSNFQRSDELMSYFHGSTMSRSGAFTQYIPFAIDPLIILAHKSLEKKPNSALDLEKIINNPSLLQSNYIRDRNHLIKKKQQKSSYESYDTITDIILYHALYEENSELLRLFLRLKQYPSSIAQQEIASGLTNDIRCYELSSIQCLAITQQPLLLRGWMSDILSSNTRLQGEILSYYDIIPVPTLLDKYPIQGRGRVVYDQATEKQQQAQQRIARFLAPSLGGNYDLRPNTLSAYQKIFQQQKYQQPFQLLKSVLHDNLSLIPGDQSVHINESLLQVLDGSYNSDLWIRQEKKKIIDQ